MPYKDPERERVAANARKRNYRSRLHEQKFGPGVGDMRGRTGIKVSGPRHHRWNNGKMLDDQGYVKVRVGKDHPLADSNGYAYEHLVVWVSAGNPLPGPNELLHHKDESRQNNRIGNLELKTKTAHNSHHVAKRQRDPRGRLLPVAAGRLLDGKVWDQRPEVLR